MLDRPARLSDHPASVSLARLKTTSGPELHVEAELDWKAVCAIGAVITGLAVLHGLTSRKWRDAHTLGVALGLLAAVGPYVLDL